MSFFYRFAVYLTVMIYWTIAIYPITEIDPILSFLVVIIGALYLAGDGKEVEK